MTTRLLSYGFLYYFVLFTSQTLSQEQVKSTNLKGFSPYFERAKQLISNGDLDSAYVYLLQLKEVKTSKVNKSELNSYLAYYYRKNNLYDSAVLYYQKALDFYEKDSLIYHKEKSSVYKGLSVIYGQISNDSLYLFYLNKALKAALKTTDSVLLSNSYNNLGVYFDKNDDSEVSIVYYKKAYDYNQTNNLISQNLGSAYIKLNKLDSANYFLRRTIEKSQDSLIKALSYFNLSRIAYLENKPEERFRYLKTSQQFLIENSGLERELHLKLLSALSDVYKNRNNWKEALSYQEKYHILNDSLNKIDVQKNIDELRTKYETDKKEEALVEQTRLTLDEKRKKTNSIIIFSGLAICIVIISYLILKNSRKKQLLAEQGKTLEMQKNLTLLKEQEINTINAMVEGQEKERKRVAEDLHDNLGSVLATLKLHFENLRINKKKKKIDQEALFDKTENLIDEAYLKVRSIAHAKNSGVIANQGLLRALQLMADKISSANKIIIEVVHFGLDRPLENSLEITVFRIIQELITNVLKHANATTASINLSRYDSILNIIVEDNGNGFNLNEINLDNGMGLHSIKTRVQHINGEFSIDTTVDKGTTVILNIPIL